jgi:hypothetical protein
MFSFVYIFVDASTRFAAGWPHRQTKTKNKHTPSSAKKEPIELIEHAESAADASPNAGGYGPGHAAS